MTTDSQHCVMDDRGFGPSDTGRDETRLVKFAIDGISYKRWLCGRHEDGLRAAFANAIEHGRKVPREKPRSTADRLEAQEIREWARSQGWNIDRRGRLPAGVREQFEAAREGRLL